MPLYTFEHPKTGKTIDILQGMNEEHVYVDDKGVKWQRVFEAPNTAIDSQIDPFNSKDFVAKTSNKKGKIGDMFDRAKDASESRKQKLGYDPVKQKYWENWSKQRNGKKPPKHLTD